MADKLKTGIVAYSYARKQHVFMREHARPSSPALPGPGPPFRPGQPSLPGPPCPLQPSCPAPATDFSLAQYRFFPWTYQIFPSREGTREKIGTKGELTSCIAATLPAAPRRAAQNVVPRNLVEMQPSACTQFSISHGSLSKSQYTPSQ